MADDFNSAPTPAGTPVPHPQQPQPGYAPPAYNPMQPPAAPASPDSTMTYYGQPPSPQDQPTVTMPDPQPWQGRPDAASPYAPTVLSAPRPQRGYPPRQYVPSAPAPVRVASRPRAVPMLAPARRRWISLPHTLLIAGVLLMLLATVLPWGVDGSGNLVTLQGATIPALGTQSGDQSAAQVAYQLLSAIGTLSAGLLFANLVLSGLNRALGGRCLAGCIVLPFYPILLALIACLLIVQVLAAGFGGLGGLAVTQQFGMGAAGVAHYEPGYYVWYTGLILNVAGMLGEAIIWRK